MFFEQLGESSLEAGVAIADQDFHVGHRAAMFDEFFENIGGPFGGRIFVDTGDNQLAGGDMDEEEHMKSSCAQQAFAGPGEEISSPGDFRLREHAFLPMAEFVPVGGDRSIVIIENISDRAVGDVKTHVLDLLRDAQIAETGFVGEFKDEVDEGAVQSRASGSGGRLGVFAAPMVAKLPIPMRDGVVSGEHGVLAIGRLVGSAQRQAGFDQKSAVFIGEGYRFEMSLRDHELGEDKGEGQVEVSLESSGQKLQESFLNSIQHVGELCQGREWAAN